MKIIGHRGWRGKFPENSLVGFKELSSIPVYAVELDIVITKDLNLLVSHEPWFDQRYCAINARKNLYELTTEEIQQIDCGSKVDDRFLNQKKMPTHKPTFAELVAQWDRLNIKPFIALEVKSESRLYGSYQPFPEVFANLLLQFERKYLKGYNYFVQSFDPFFLKTYHALNPQTNTGLLVENKADFDKDLKKLGYTPAYYNPEHVLLTDKLLTQLENKGVKSYTWTVNTIQDFNKIKNLPLAGVITDYPETLVAL